jgi:hypothetical protein
MIDSTDELLEGDRIVIKRHPLSGRGEIAAIQRDGLYRLRLDSGMTVRCTPESVMREPQDE